MGIAESLTVNASETWGRSRLFELDYVDGARGRGLLDLIFEERKVHTLQNGRRAARDVYLKNLWANSFGISTGNATFFDPYSWNSHSLYFRLC